MKSYPYQDLILWLLAFATSAGLGLSDPASDPGLGPGPPTVGAPAPAPKVSASSDFQCDLPPILDPSLDRLPSADQLFSSHAALMLQVKRHQALVRIPSITYDDMGPPDQDARWRPFRELHRVLRQTYPAVHNHSTLETINSLALLYTIEGSNPNLKPILLAAHQDVVPVADEKAWRYPPFEAHFDGQRLWGRGAMDDKCSLTAIMSALEALLACPSWKPSRTILLAFGFDEETGGVRGAAEIAARIDSRYQNEDGSDSLALVVDEGGLGLETVGDVVYALPSVYEKGYVDIWLELQTVGGHSSLPPPHTAIGIMAHLLVALEAHPYEPKMLADGPIHRQLICQTRYSPDANPELSQAVRGGDLEAITQAWIRARPELRYLIQTSQAIDVISGGLKINALPEVVSVGVNYRIAPQDSIELVQRRLASTLADVASQFNLTVRSLEGKDSNEAPERLLRKQHQSSLQSWLPSPGRDLVAESAEAGLEADFGPDSATLWIRRRDGLEKSPMAPTDGPIWDTLAGSIRYTFSSGNLTVVPAGQGMTQNTDTCHYQNLTKHIYRWMPTRPGDYDGVHTVDENILMEGHINFVKFYYDLVRNFDAHPV